MSLVLRFDHHSGWPPSSRCSHCYCGDFLPLQRYNLPLGTASAWMFPESSGRFFQQPWPIHPRPWLTSGMGNRQGSGSSDCSWVTSAMSQTQSGILNCSGLARLGGLCQSQCTLSALRSLPRPGSGRPMKFLGSVPATWGPRAPDRALDVA